MEYSGTYGMLRVPWSVRRAAEYAKYRGVLWIIRDITEYADHMDYPKYMECEECMGVHGSAPERTGWDGITQTLRIVRISRITLEGIREVRISSPLPHLSMYCHVLVLFI